MSKAILIVGMTGEGKTTVAKNLASQFYSDKLLIYDVNNEYSDYGEGVRPADQVDEEQFLSECQNSRGKVVLIEESTIFFGVRKSNDKLRRLLVSKRHHNNIYLLLFHSLGDIPTNVFRLCNYLYLLKTNDSEKAIDTKFDSFPDIQEAYHLLKSKPKYSLIKIKLI